MLSGLVFLSFVFTMYFNFAVRYNNLLVDAYMAVLAVGALAGVYAYRKNPNRIAFHVTLLLSVLVLVKTSAIFFVAIVLIFLIARMIYIHNKYHVQVLTPTVWTLIVPFAFNYTWTLHVNQVIGDAATTKH